MLHVSTHTDRFEAKNTTWKHIKCVYMLLLKTGIWIYKLVEYNNNCVLKSHSGQAVKCRIAITVCLDCLTVSYAFGKVLCSRCECHYSSTGDGHMGSRPWTQRYTLCVCFRHGADAKLRLYVSDLPHSVSVVQNVGCQVSSTTAMLMVKPNMNAARF